MEKDQTCESMGTHHDYATSEIEVNAYSIEELDKISKISGETYHYSALKKNKSIILFCKNCGKIQDINLR